MKVSLNNNQSFGMAYKVSPRSKNIVNNAFLKLPKRKQQKLAYLIEVQNNNPIDIYVSHDVLSGKYRAVVEEHVFAGQKYPNSLYSILRDAAKVADSINSENIRMQLIKEGRKPVIELIGEDPHTKFINGIF